MASACIESPGAIRLRRRFHRVAQRLRTRGGKWLSVAMAAFLVPAALPVMGLCAIFGARLRGTRRSGKLGRPFTEYTLVRRNGEVFPVAGYWPRLCNLVRGELAWVGPEPRENHDLTAEPARRIASVEPGLVCAWRVRKRTNIAYESQSCADLSYVETRTARSDAGIAARALLALVYGRVREEYSETAEILGLPLDNVTLDEAVENILRPSGHTRQVSFINVDCVNRSCRDPEYQAILRNSDLRLADGIGLRIAGHLLHSEIRQNVNGTDLFPVLCETMQKRGYGIFLLGGRPGVCDEVAARITARFPGLRVRGTRHGYFRPDEESAVVDAINASGADVLLVAFGAPLQEKWIRRNQHRLAVRSALGVGGLFDFYSGRIPRAPQWLREIGLEWAYRLYQEPGRMWRRYLVGNALFLARVFAEKVIANTGARRRTQQVKSI